MPLRRAGSAGDYESTRNGSGAGSTEDGGSEGGTDNIGATERTAAPTAAAAAVTQPQATTTPDRRHRDRRAHTRGASHSQRSERRTGGRGQRSSGSGSGGGHHRRTSTVGPSTPRRRSATQSTHPPNKGSRKLRSWLGAFAPTASKVPAPAQTKSKSRSRKGNRSGSSRSSNSNSTKADTKNTATTSKAAQPAGAPAKPPPRRLGKAELGKYADEDHMPDKVAAYLQNGWGVRREGIIPTLATLLEQSKKTEYAYLCDPCVQHVSRLPREGPFCGYRNIQTLYSYIVSAGLPGHDRFGGALPSIFDVQDLIEEAWDKNFNAQGRIETGGVRGTRKYIGTPEAVAVFQSLGVPITVRALYGQKPGGVQSQLAAEVQQYFAQGVRAAAEEGHKVRRTRLPPIYWQQPGHSVTVVGLERTRTGDTNLLVLDPNYMQTPVLLVLLGGQRRATANHPDRLLQAYRRSPRYVARFQATELLLLRPRKEDVVTPKTSQQAVSDTTGATKG